jgi:hypothetical protein
LNFQGFLGRLADFAKFVLYVVLCAIFGKESLSLCSYTSSLKSKIPWLSPQSISKGIKKEETSSNLILDFAVKRSKELTPDRSKQYDLLDNLQDMAPFYLPSR